MHIIVCVDNHGGMLFHERRQSRDRALRKRIMERIGTHRLWMSSYSFGQFADVQSEALTVDDDFLERAQEEDYCFVEREELSPYLSRISSLTVYRWNRSYPYDKQLSLELSAWKLCSCYEFAGYSHEKITEEVYRR